MRKKIVDEYAYCDNNGNTYIFKTSMKINIKAVNEAKDVIRKCCKEMRGEKECIN